MAIINLTQSIIWDSSKQYADQTEDCQRYCNDLSNYTKYNYNKMTKDETPDIFIKEYTFNRDTKEIVRELRWHKTSNKYLGDEIYVREYYDDWHYQNRSKRVFLADNVIGKQIGVDTDFANLILYILSPPADADPDPNIDIDKIHVNDYKDGWYGYFDTILTAHEAVLNKNGVYVQDKIV